MNEASKVNTVLLHYDLISCKIVLYLFLQAVLTSFTLLQKSWEALSLPFSAEIIFIFISKPCKGTFPQCIKLHLIDV